MSFYTRIAPTPSGYLHAGNIFNFCMVYVLAQKYKANIQLRIDDADALRIRPEYVDDIFRVLDWMGISWNSGPTHAQDFYQNYSQQLRKPAYELLIQNLADKALLFDCGCSRNQLSLGKHHVLCNTNQTQLPIAKRIKMVKPIQIALNDGFLGPTTFVLHNFPEPIIEKKDGFAAYSVCSLADDIANDINLIVRGSDLLEQTALQIHLASLIGNSSFSKTIFFHHPLMLNNIGEKLSKSSGAQAHSIYGDEGLKKLVLQHLAQFLTIDKSPNNLSDLADAYISISM
jgi:glutamyl/glutaminyl-tRNA synthetase